MSNIVPVQAKFFQIYKWKCMTKVVCVMLFKLCFISFYYGDIFKLNLRNLEISASLEVRRIICVDR